ncbi:MAG TPA: glycosyl transferase family 1, partial [Bacteroidales bacterium]|nr:glycosyl transferase family 1 [Bacteroidales bacterium]
HISLGEGLPLAILEAMSIGKPIIATPVGGIPEVIDNGRNGLLVEPDADKVVQTINTLLNDEELRTTLGRNAYVDSKKYTWENSAKKFLEIFEGRA